VNVLDDTIGQEDSMLKVQIHAVLCRTIPDLLQVFPVVGMSSIEYKIERRMRFSGEA
jgi:hypothetical protein